MPFIADHIVDQLARFKEAALDLSADHVVVTEVKTARGGYDRQEAAPTQIQVSIPVPASGDEMEVAGIQDTTAAYTILVVRDQSISSGDFLTIGGEDFEVLVVLSPVSREVAKKVIAKKR